MNKTHEPVFARMRYGAKSKAATRGLPRPKPRYRKWGFIALLAVIRKQVQEAIEKYGDQTHVWFTVEQVAEDHKAKIPLVRRCFAILNQEGLLYQEETRGRGDFVRGHETHSGKRTSRSTGWSSNIFRIRDKSKESKNERSPSMMVRVKKRFKGDKQHAAFK